MFGNYRELTSNQKEIEIKRRGTEKMGVKVRRGEERKNGRKGAKERKKGLKKEGREKRKKEGNGKEKRTKPPIHISGYAAVHKATYLRLEQVFWRYVDVAGLGCWCGDSL